MYGENGSGKSTLINSLIQKEHLNKVIIPLKLTNFINMSELYEIISMYLTEYLKIISPSHAQIIQIKKWIDLYETLEDYDKLMKIYFLIDDIEDIHNFLFFNKNLLKLFALANSFDTVKLILVSNFDITQSELRNVYDFSSFVSICVNQRSKKETKEILQKNLNEMTTESKIFQEIINKCVANFEYPLMNLNEILFCTKENVENFTKIPSELNLEMITNQMNSITIENGTSDQYPRKKYDPQLLSKAIMQQIQYSPLHIKKLNENQEQEEKTKSNMETSLLHSGKNLTESLSRSQKALLLASFLANETSPNNDSNVFKSTKRSHKRNRKGGFSLKSKASHAFHINRLLAIYSALRSIIDNDSQNKLVDINIELISDIGTLSNLNLIRVVKSNEANIMSRKFISCIGIDFALKIAEDFNLHLDDFMHYEKN